MFFVLSGFLITRILIKTRESKHYFRNFYVRRFLRIFPLYYLFLALFFFVLPRIDAFIGLFSVDRAHFSWHLLFASNLLFSKLGFYPGHIVDVSWSLAIEEQFYLFWPFLVWTLSLKQLRWTCLFFFLLSQALIATQFVNHGTLNSTYFFTLTRWDGIILGSALAATRPEPELWKQFIRFRNHILLMSLGLSLLAFSKGIHTTSPLIQFIGFPSFAIFFSCLLSKLLESGPLFDCFSLRPLKVLGKYSYGLYLFNKPTVIVLNKFLTPIFNSTFLQRVPDVSMFLFQFLAISASLGVAIPLFYCYEKPFLKLKNRFGSAA